MDEQLEYYFRKSYERLAKNNGWDVKLTWQAYKRGDLMVCSRAEDGGYCVIMENDLTEDDLVRA